jgi:hypothetical protein
MLRVGLSDNGFRLRHWVALLACAEVVGMIAAAAAARAGQALVSVPAGAGQVAVAVGLATVGGTVEGAAVGLATARLLSSRVPGFRVRRWVAVTTAVAALGWAGGTVPSALAGADPVGEAGSSEPTLGLLVVAGLGLGIVLGALLGWAQSMMLRHRVSHPFRWVGANALAWAPAMAIIFVGASAPGGDWPLGAVLALAAVTGGLAGAALGLVLGWSAPSLTGPSATGRILLAMIRSRHRFAVPRSVIGLKIRGRRSGQWHQFPVIAIEDGDAFVVLPGKAHQKRWWRNLTRPSAVEVLRSGIWEPAEARVVSADDVAYANSLEVYRRNYPRIEVPARAPLVRIVLRS